MPATAETDVRWICSISNLDGNRPHVFLYSSNSKFEVQSSISLVVRSCFDKDYLFRIKIITL